jgi:hypothetical protein
MTFKREVMIMIQRIKMVSLLLDGQIFILTNLISGLLHMGRLWP